MNSNDLSLHHLYEQRLLWENKCSPFHWDSIRSYHKFVTYLLEENLVSSCFILSQSTNLSIRYNLLWNFSYLSLKETQFCHEFWYLSLSWNQFQISLMLWIRTKEESWYMFIFCNQPSYHIFHSKMHYLLIKFLIKWRILDFVLKMSDSWLEVRG